MVVYKLNECLKMLDEAGLWFQLRSICWQTLLVTNDDFLAQTLKLLVSEDGSITASVPQEIGIIISSYR